MGVFGNLAEWATVSVPGFGGTEGMIHTVAVLAASSTCMNSKP